MMGISCVATHIHSEIDKFLCVRMAWDDANDMKAEQTKETDRIENLQMKTHQ